MLTTALTILPVFLIILAGYGAARSGAVPARHAGTINLFVVWIPLPALLFHVVATTDWHMMWNGDFVIALLGSCLLMFTLGLLIGKWRGHDGADRAVDALAAGYPNAGYLGLPLLMLVVGPAGAAYALVAFCVALSAIFGLSIFLIELAQGTGADRARALRRAMIAVARNPVMVAPVLGLLWWLTGIPLPPVLERALALLGDSASPTALVGIGLLLAQHPLRAALANGSVLLLSFAKLVLHPLLTAFIALRLLHMDAGMARIAIILAAMPTGTGPFMLTGLYRRDGTVAAGTILLSTVASVVTISATLAFFPG